VQATVHDYDQATACGTLVRDDGVLVPFGAEAFARSRLRLLRPGQRLTVDVEDGVVVALRLVGV
jgi:2-phospho-L-lactate guanylyltransferase